MRSDLQSDTESLTIVVSVEGIEDKTPEQLDEMFQKAGY